MPPSGNWSIITKTDAEEGKEKMKKKVFVILAAALCCVLSANEGLKIPAWLQVKENGNLVIDKINFYFGVTDFKRGNDDSGKASKFLCPVSTIELDSRIWRSVLTPYSDPEYKVTVDKKLSVLADDTVSWRNSFTANKPNVIKGAHVTLSLPPEPFDLVIDGKMLRFGKSYRPGVGFRGSCKQVTVITSGTELEITGEKLFLSTSDMRRYNPVFRINLSFEMRADDPKSWQSSSLDLVIRRAGIRMDRETFFKLKKNFTPISLAGILNNTVTDDKADDGICGWTDKGPEDCLSSYRFKGRTEFCGIPFELPDPAAHQGRVLVGVSHPARRLNLPSSVTIPMNGIRAGGLYFLHASSWIGKPSPGSYLVRYADGSSVEIPLLTNRNIFNWYTCGSSPQAAVGWKAPQGSAGLTLFPWTNPAPEKEIASISLSVNPARQSESMEYTPVLLLFGITAVDRKPFLPEEEMTPPVDDSGWITFDGCNQIEGSILDNSALNHVPAGRYGWVTVKGDRFFFENGKEARFFGFTTAVTGQSFSRERVAAFARRLHALGCNIVRFIGLPGPGEPDAARRVYRQDSRSELDPARMDTFCFFIGELKKNGVYIELDLRGGNVIDDEIPGMKGARWDHYSLLSPAVEQLQIANVKRILSYRNPYTGIPIGEDPVIAMVMVENEDSLFYEANLAAMGNPAALREFQAGFNRMLREKYSDRETLKRAWKGSLGDGEDPAKGTVEAPLDFKKRDFSPERKRELRAWLAQRQGEHYRNVIRAVRESGCKAPAIGSNHWTGDMLDFYVNAENADIFDRHSYWSHPVVDLGWDLHEISFSNQPSVGLPDGGFLKSFVTRRVVGMPYAQTEWDVSSTNEFRADAQLFIPAYASMHGWSLFHFHFPMEDFQLKWNPRWRTNTLLPPRDPLQMALWPAVAAMYHKGDVRRADRSYYETLTREDVLAGKKPDVERIARAGLRGIAGINFDPAYPVKSDSSLLPPEDAGVIESVTGELFWDIQNRQFRVVTPGSRGFSGFTNGKTVVCKETVFDLRNDFAAVILTSRDGVALDRSRRILMTAVARCWNTGTRYNSLKTRFAESGKPPILLEPVRGTVSFPASRELAVYPLDFSGKRTGRGTTSYRDGRLTVSIGDAVHYELVAE